MEPVLDDWLIHAADPRVLIVAHNAEFERLILRHVFKLDLPASKFRCTAAQAARAGLPRSLDLAGQVLGLAHQKDKATGKRVLAKLCKPRRMKGFTGGEAGFWEEGDKPEDFEALYEYNAGDVLTMVDLHAAIPELSPQEQAIWELTVEMNDRGLAVDTASIPLAIAAADRDTARLAARWYELTGTHHGAKGGAAAVGLDSLAKAAVRKALRDPSVSLRVREALLVRQRIAKTSVRKLNTLRNRVDADGRYRGALIYAGAERTARWSGGGVQLHNMPRGLGEETDTAFGLLALDALELGWDEPLRTISEMIRGFFVGPYHIGDYGQIEARVLAWLARQDDLLAAFAAGEDIYCQMASAIYQAPVTKADYDEKLHIAKRQLGKIAVLGCGYGLGPAKFQQQMEDNFEVLLREEDAQRVVSAYRGRYPRIPRLWYKLEEAFRLAIALDATGFTHPDLPGLVVGVQYFGARRFAFIRLPSGRPMYYYDPRITNGRVSYIGRNQYKGGKWERVDTYGGKLVENVVQAVSRDALAEAMLRLRDAGYRQALTVHDEVVAEATSGWGLSRFEELMVQRPAWAPDLPLVVEAFTTRRYRK
jgi:DNA polymerase